MIASGRVLPAWIDPAAARAAASTVGQSVPAVTRGGIRRGVDCMTRHSHVVAEHWSVQPRTLTWPSGVEMKLWNCGACAVGTSTYRYRVSPSPEANQPVSRQVVCELNWSPPGTDEG